MTLSKTSPEVVSLALDLGSCVALPKVDVGDGVYATDLGAWALLLKERGWYQRGQNKILRPAPWRPARWYPIGTRLTLRDGRLFEVVEQITEFEHDPSYGNGGMLETGTMRAKVWKRVWEL